MPSVFVIALSLHMLAATFWAGTSFTLARTGGLGAERLVRPQLAAALIAIVSGGYLGHLAHAGGFTPMVRVLALGAVCALVAAALQATSAIRRRFAVPAQRAAAVLLAVTAVCMVAARYA